MFLAKRLFQGHLETLWIVGDEPVAAEEAAAPKG
jgi:hypothetical protein